jgi:hypothetical protein
VPQLATAALVLLSACLATPGTTGQAVTGGTPDDGDPAVVGLTLRGRPYCTGTLVAARVVLTSGHCAAFFDPADIGVVFGPEVTDESEVLRLLEARPHPGYSLAQYGNDIALLLLAQRSEVPPARLPATDGDLYEGQPVRLVGYGRPIPAGRSGRKHQGTAAVSALTRWISVLEPAPAMFCAGDSGGPGFVKDVSGEEIVAGVNTVGEDTCAGLGQQTRVDFHRPGWIAPYLDATADGAAELGDRCLFQGHCAEGLRCTSALDAPSLAFCARACANGDACRPGMSCAPDGVCRWPAPSPGAPDGPCTRDLDCPGGEICAAAQSGGSATCRTRCAPNFSCPSGTRCGLRAGEPVGIACFPAPPKVGGCAGAGAGAGLSSLWVLTLLLAVRRPRRVCRTLQTNVES